MKRSFLKKKTLKNLNTCIMKQLNDNSVIKTFTADFTHNIFRQLRNLK